MAKVKNTERDNEIRQKRAEGLGLKEISEMYGISVQRAGKICGPTGYIKKKEPKKKPEKKEGLYIIRNGGAECYLTKIIKVKNQPIIYQYGSKKKEDAMRFTREEAERIAELRKAVMVEV